MGKEQQQHQHKLKNKKMATKYIVDNVANQTISGNVTINGNLSVAKGLDDQCIFSHMLNKCVTIDTCYTDDFYV